jgi:hypothetical protein
MNEHTDSHAAGEGLNGTLGAGVDGVLWNTLGLASDGAHQDDAAANLEMPVGFPCNEELSSCVDVEDAVELLWGDILHVAEGDNTGVGADNVELGECLLCLLEHLDGLVDVGDVGLDGDGLAAELLDFLDNQVGSLSAVGVVDNDIGTTAGKLNSHGFSNTTAYGCCQYVNRHSG